MNKCIRKLVITLCLVEMTLFSFSPLYADGIYYDNETGISFELPNGWKTIGLSTQNRNFAKERFSTDNNTDLFVFMSANLYERLDENTKANIDRNELLGYRIGDNEIKELLNDSKDYSSYRNETLGGVKWYILESATMDTYEQYINGNMIGFTLVKLMSDERTKEVKSIIASVSESELLKEKIAIDAQSIENKPFINDNSNGYSSSLAKSIEEENNKLIIALTIEFFVAVSFYFVKKGWDRKAKSRITICPNCKKENPSNYKYCVKCGHSLYEEEKE